MSSLIVEVTTIDDIRPHLNSDNLELAIVKGWQSVVPKGVHVPGQRVVFFPPDTVLPPETSDRFGVTKYLSKGRILCAKLRGEPSFGLVVTPDDPNWPAGLDVAEHYGVTKYEPPVRLSAGDAEVDHPLFPRYTEIENLRNYPDILEPGEMVYISEKLHGTNCRVALIEGQFMAGSHGLRRKEPESRADSIYWYPLTLEPVVQLLTELGSMHSQAVLFGEVYGPGIQNLHYGLKKPAFAAFDILANGKYLDYQDFASLCALNGVDVVPRLAIIPYSIDIVRAAASGASTVPGANHVREGVVVKPLRERTHPKVGRVVLKYISDTYLLKGREEFADR